MKNKWGWEGKREEVKLARIARRLLLQSANSGELLRVRQNQDLGETDVKKKQDPTRDKKKSILEQKYYHCNPITSVFDPLNS